MTITLVVPEIDLKGLRDEELELLCKDNARKENELRTFAIKAQAEKIYRLQVRQYGSVEAAQENSLATKRKYKLPKLTAELCIFCGRNLGPNDYDSICSKCLPT